MHVFKVPEDKKEILVKLFSKHHDSMITSCIQNYFGHAWVDDMDCPTSGRIISGAFCFLAGEPKRELLDMPSQFRDDFLILVPDSERWFGMIEQIYAQRYEKGERYAIKKEGDIFDRDKLREFVRRIEPEYEIHLLGEQDYYEVMREEWSRDFCSQFRNWQDYQARGLGVVIMHYGEIVAGASSYTSYREGIEVEIVTREDYRRKGLALASGAGLILAALERGLYPNWDARTMISVGVAQKLGYHFDKPYTVYDVWF